MGDVIKVTGIEGQQARVNDVMRIACIAEDDCVNFLGLVDGHRETNTQRKLHKSQLKGRRSTSIILHSTVSTIVQTRQ